MLGLELGSVLGSGLGLGWARAGLRAGLGAGLQGPEAALPQPLGMLKGSGLQGWVEPCAGICEPSPFHLKCIVHEIYHHLGSFFKEIPIPCLLWLCGPHRFCRHFLSLGCQAVSFCCCH